MYISTTLARLGLSMLHQCFNLYMQTINQTAKYGLPVIYKYPCVNIERKVVFSE